MADRINRPGEFDDLGFPDFKVGESLQIHKRKFLAEPVALKLLDRARAPRDFSGHTTAKSVKKVSDFTQRFSKSLRSAEIATTVPATIVAATLFMETTYSNKLGQYPALDTLLSWAALGDENLANEQRERALAIAKAKPKLYPKISEINWNDRIPNIAEKGYRELKAFLILCSLARWDLDRVHSSWAGALGRGQYIPSTALRLMTQNGRFVNADLKSWGQTIYFTARHIQEKGWNPAATDAEKFKAVQDYNGLPEYARAVFKIRESLEPDRSRLVVNSK